ncbi:MAG TPA: hypothetical protein VER55_00205 [Ardenticatenaceae bacterium]|nr:hypothetical protein [Ardenticatenaceae bacterium]
MSTTTQQGAPGGSPDPPIVLSDTGPLISIFQSGSLELVAGLFGAIHTSEGCITELIEHGWGEVLVQAGAQIPNHRLTRDELLQAAEIAQRIATLPEAGDSEPDTHLGEAEVIVLSQRPQFAGSVLLLDERAARTAASGLTANVAGFAAVLLLAAERGLLTPDDVRRRLERCREEGTPYSIAFTERVYERARGGTA